MFILRSLGLALLLASAAAAQSSEPANLYLFPAGGRRGTQVKVRLEGENVPSLCDFHLESGRGVTAPAQARDRDITLTIAPDSAPGLVRWRIGTAQGGTARGASPSAIIPRSSEARSPGRRRGAAARHLTADPERPDRRRRPGRPLLVESARGSTAFSRGAGGAPWRADRYEHLRRPVRQSPGRRHL